ncbi:MAG: sugar transferase [bacterium]
MDPRSLHSRKDRGKPRGIYLRLLGKEKYKYFSLPWLRLKIKPSTVWCWVFKLTKNQKPGKIKLSKLINMKKFELSFAFLQLPLDYLLLVLAGFTAYQLRFTDVMTSIRPVVFKLTWQSYWPLVMLVALGWLVIFALAGLYHTNPNRKLLKDLRRLMFACTTGFGAITIYVFFTLQKFDSRFLVLAGWILAIIYVSLGRIMMKGLKALLHIEGIGSRKTVIIGSEKIAEQINNFLKTRQSLGYKIIANHEHFDEQVAQKILKNKPDEIIFTDPKANVQSALKAISFANENHIGFKYSADLFATVSSRMTVSTMAGIPIIELQRTRLSGWGSILKRIFDIFTSSILIIVLSPIYIFLIVAILIETGLPIIYKNERVGQAGKKFFTLKFRSMLQKYCTGKQFGKQDQLALKKEQELIKNQSIKQGPVYKIKDDPRVTKFGRFIRRWSLDEFPQFFNVLKGDMSLVGPRPHQPREVENYEQQHKIVLAIKPGITGLAQISGRSDLNWEEEVKLDTFYIENWSLLLDLIILIKTPFVVLLKKGAW